MTKYIRAVKREVRIVTDEEWEEICKQEKAKWKALPLKTRIVRNLTDANWWAGAIILSSFGGLIIWIILEAVGIVRS